MVASKPKFKIIIGLGNPDPQYKNTYHNVGHLFIDYLMIDPKLQIKNPNLQIHKSTAYMNVSGVFVRRILKKTGTKPEQLLIMHDDSDITLGNYKLSFGRGAAGHHGVENIMATLKTKNFWRLRIGVRPAKENPPTGRRQKAEQFILKKITPENKRVLEAVFPKIIGVIENSKRKKHR